ncbi:hypothetical protein DY000_02053496 [Brassica cretica]|uniref:Uncharacterized protein n=1 Tax=Brassica cretica TaxID=69181 RepID=A0ABQ7A8R8_BRACR|nr:hypothetical protein DY000_02053496 [Brassica cretica]
MSLHQVLEYHMEFLETFGCNWSSKEVIKVIIGRAVHGSDLTGATPRSHCDTPSERLGQSDAEKSLAFSSLGGTRVTLPERRGEVARIFITRSDVSQRPLQVAPEAWSDYWRSLRAFCLLDFMFTQGPFGHFIMHVFTF